MLGEIHQASSLGDIRREATRVDHVIDMLPTCQRIMTIVQAGIKREGFSEGTHMRATIEVILADTHNAFQYRKRRRNQGNQIYSTITSICILIIFVL